MQQYITSSRIANAIMQDKSFDGFYLIVEGKKDYKLYNKFICNENIKIRQAFGKEKVKEVIKILDERNFEKKFAILDLDFDRINGTKENNDNIFKTDCHDSEVMILSTRALENTINNYCNTNKIRQFERSKNKSIRKIIFDLGSKIGKLKLANNNENLGLSFKPKELNGNKLKYCNFISNTDLSFLGLDKLIETVFNYSNNRSNNRSEKQIIYKEYLKVDKIEYDINDLVNGHDLTNILFIFIKKIMKSSSKSIKDSDSIEESIILAYETSYFKETNLYKSIKQWGEDNKIKIFNFEDYLIDARLTS